jgi:hypothetical protein
MDFQLWFIWLYNDYCWNVINNDDIEFQNIKWLHNEQPISCCMTIKWLEDE